MAPKKWLPTTMGKSSLLFFFCILARLIFIFFQVLRSESKAIAARLEQAAPKPRNVTIRMQRRAHTTSKTQDEYAQEAKRLARELSTTKTLEKKLKAAEVRCRGHLLELTAAKETILKLSSERNNAINRVGALQKSLDKAKQRTEILLCQNRAQLETIGKMVLHMFSDYLKLRKTNIFFYIFQIFALPRFSHIHLSGPKLLDIQWHYHVYQWVAWTLPRLPPSSSTKL